MSSEMGSGLRDRQEDTYRAMWENMEDNTAFDMDTDNEGWGLGDWMSHGMRETSGQSSSPSNFASGNGGWNFPDIGQASPSSTLSAPGAPMMNTLGRGFHESAGQTTNVTSPPASANNLPFPQRTERQRPLGFEQQQQRQREERRRRVSEERQQTRTAQRDRDGGRNREARLVRDQHLGLLPGTSEAQSQARAANRRAQVDHTNAWLDPLTTGTAHNGGYIPGDLFQTLSDSDEESSINSSASQRADSDNVIAEDSDNMPTTRRNHAALGGARRSQTQRDVPIDLTSTSPPEPSTDPRRRSAFQSHNKRSADEAEPDRATKRSRPTISKSKSTEELDLTTENPSAEEELQQKQTAELVQQQQSGQDDGPIKIGKRQCIICLEPYTNATTSHCGHVFCHECLTRALIASEKSSGRGIGNCPACRKPINMKKQMVPINFMKKSAFKTKGRPGTARI